MPAPRWLVQHEQTVTFALILTAVLALGAIACACMLAGAR